MKKKILLVVTGSVAVEKFEHIYNLLKGKFDLKIIATKYVLDNFKFSSNIKFEEENKKLNTFPKHIELAKWASQIVVVPATANTLAKFNSGIADSQVLSTLLAARQPIVFIPAMNSYMYASLKERNIIANLSNMGHIFIGPCIGKLREGEVGIGRMVEPKEIAILLEQLLSSPKNKKVLISSGASKVYIDPIRYITNGATGNFASLISNELRKLGHSVEVLDISTYTNKEVIEIIKNKSVDVYISTAAFSDFDVFKFSSKKIKKESAIKKIDLKTNVDVLKSVSSLKMDIYGFKLDDEKESAIKKMKKLDLKGMLWNKIPAMGSPKISGSFILKDKEIEFENMPKEEVAKLIAQEI